MAITVVDNVQRGQAKRISATFFNTSAALADPNALTFTFKNPAGSSTTYTYGTDTQLVKDSTGAYHVDLTFTSSGLWVMRFAATGIGAATGVDQAVYAYIYVGSDAVG